MNLRRLANSIATRLILVGIGIILVGVVLRYTMLSSFLREDLEKLVATQHEALATYVARDIDYKLRERQSLLSHLARTLPLPLLHSPDRLRAWLGERQDLQPQFSQGLLVVDRAGRMLSAYPQRLQAGMGLDPDRDDVRAALAGVPSIGKPARSPLDREAVLPMAAPVKDASGEVQAVIIGVSALAAPGFLDLLMQTRVGETGGFLLISPRDRLFVAASDAAMVLRPTPPAGSDRLLDRAMAGYRGTGMTINADGGEEVSAMAPVPTTGWFVVARLPSAEAFAIIAHSQRFILRSSVVVVIVFVLLATAGLAVVLRPLFVTAAHADRMTLGELPLEPLPIIRADEVGHLTEAFNRLLAKLQGSQAELARMAHHDILTGLPNRAMLSDRMGQALARAHRNGTRLAVLFIDLDGFKSINDTFGHEAGDTVLVGVAHRVAGVLRETDTLARIGGDEFIIVAGDLDPAPGVAEGLACAIADKCARALETPIAVNGRQIPLTLSIGVVLGDGQSQADALMSGADAAMYKAKQGGRSRYELAGAPVSAIFGLAVQLARRVSLTPSALSKAERSEQLERYRSGLANLILTDYVEFRLYRAGEQVRDVRLAKWAKDGTLRRDPLAAGSLPELFAAFFNAKVPTVSSARELA
ncbi:MAG: diguanylate cyclase, partial [Zoogloea sp.]|nr:diguanylate cyclase [Zoogloea sp.]